MLLLGTLRWRNVKGLVKGHRSGTELSLFSTPLSAFLGKACGPFSLDLDFRENLLSPVQPPLLWARVPLDCLPIWAQGRPSIEEGLLFPAGKFWHISDLHLDPDYKVSSDPLQVCPSAGSQPVPNAGPWGDYLCDSPWVLINSSIYTMKEIEPEPDFILWTG